MKRNFKQLRQDGASLMEVLVAMSISLVVTAAMIALMSNSLNTTARIIKMTKLTDDMRVALQMMSRDVRRSSYNANSLFCYANSNCGTDGSITTAGDIDIDGECLTFLMDRDHDGDSTENDAGGFRRVSTDDGVGFLEMWTGDNTPDCSDAAGVRSWVQLTDPADVDITAFTLDDTALSYTETIINTGGTQVRQRVRKVSMTLAGRLVLDPNITREVADVIDVRNDLLL